MGKTICVALLTLMVFICDIANACVSGIGRSEGTNRYTSTTVCQTGNLGAFMVGGGSSNGGSSYTPPEYYAAMKENAKKEEEGKRAYCKANNYPTHVPFCAGFKEQERLKKVQECRSESVGRTERCNLSAVNLHKIDSAWCSGAKWLGGVAGLAGTWTASQGEGAATVLLGGTALTLIQKGDDCQTDLDRVRDASMSICGTDQARRDLDCDAIK